MILEDLYINSKQPCLWGTLLFLSISQARLGVDNSVGGLLPRSNLQNSSLIFFLVDDKKMMGEGLASDTGPESIAHSALST